MKTKNKIHPLTARVRYEADIRGISDKELAVSLRMSPNTFYRRKVNPNDWSVDELIKLAKKLRLEIVITADGLECR